MKLSTVKKIALPLLLSTSLVGGMAYAGGGFDGDKGHRGPDHHMKRVLDKIDLTDAQEDKIDDIMDANFDDMKTDFDKFRSIDDQLNTLTQAETLDNAAVDALLEQKLALMKARMQQSVTAKHQVWAVLTPEQQSEAKALIAKYKEKMQKRMQDRKDRKDRKDD